MQQLRPPGCSAWHRPGPCRYHRHQWSAQAGCQSVQTRQEHPVPHVRGPTPWLHVRHRDSNTRLHSTGPAASQGDSTTPSILQQALRPVTTNTPTADGAPSSQSPQQPDGRGQAPQPPATAASQPPASFNQSPQPSPPVTDTATVASSQPPPTQGSVTQAVASGAVTAPASTTAASTSTWSTPAAGVNAITIDSLQSELEIQKEIQRQEEILKQLLSGQATSSSSSAPESPETAGTEGTDTNTGSQSTSDPALPVYAQPFLTWFLCGWAWVVLFQQWAPLWGTLWERVTDGWSGLVLASGVALLVPNTPAANNHLMDMMAWVNGNWSWAAVKSSVMYGGLLPTLVFTRGLLNVGGVLERAYGPLVMASHVAMAAWGAAAAQLLLASAPLTITGPAVVSGLYVGLAFILYKEQRALQQLEARSGSPASSATLGTQLASESSSPRQALSDEEKEQLLKLKVVPRTAWLMWGLALVLGCVQPMLTAWGVLGGMAGGLVAGFTSAAIVRGTGWLLTQAMRLAIKALALLLRVPAVVAQFLVSLSAMLGQTLQDAVKAFRRM